MSAVRMHGDTANGKLLRLFNALPTELQSELEQIWERRHVPVGEVLIEDGEETTRIGYLLDGLLGMVKELSDRRRHIIGLLVPTDMYGRAFDGASGYRIEALTDSVVLTCDRARFEALLGQAPEAERLFLLNVLDELDAAREWVLVLSGTKVVQRLAAFLLILARRKLHERDRRAANGPLNLRLTLRRADLAHYLGARPESLSRAFHQLEREGVIRLNGPYDFDLLDMTGLVETAGHDLLLDGPG